MITVFALCTCRHRCVGELHCLREKGRAATWESAVSRMSFCCLLIDTAALANGDPFGRREGRRWRTRPFGRMEGRPPGRRAVTIVRRLIGMLYRIWNWR